MSKFMFRDPPTKPWKFWGLMAGSVILGAIIAFALIIHYGPDPESLPARSIADEVKSCHEREKLPTILLNAAGQQIGVLCEER